MNNFVNLSPIKFKLGVASHNGKTQCMDAISVILSHKYWPIRPKFGQKLPETTQNMRKRGRTKAA